MRGTSRFFNAMHWALKKKKKKKVCNFWCIQLRWCKLLSHFGLKWWHLGHFWDGPIWGGGFEPPSLHGRRYGTNLNFEKAMFFLTFFTPLKINMEPKNEGLEDDYPFQTGDVQVPR